jgi:carbamoyl-phosphate synthase small subunit
MMIKSVKNTAVLLLEDGSVYYGVSAGYSGTVGGEICFNTGMTGYQEIFTDPSYKGQVLIMTNVHIGNYGIRHLERESENIQISGLICKRFTNDYNRPMADESIQEYFERNKLVAITEVDTRALVRKVRSEGAMNCLISTETEDIDGLKSKLAALPKMHGLELSSKVSTSESYDIGEESASYRVAAIDLGIKKSILKNLTNRGCFVRVFPAKTPFEEVMEWNPDGFFISNGPGDPSSMEYAVTTVRSMLNTKKPLFGICLGHQILALAIGVPTYKMHHGHRGINHPVLNVITGKCEITSQNHGFGVDPDAIKSQSDKIEITHINLNDDTIEGISLKEYNAFSVQYHPEASPGPHDSNYLFDQFLQRIQESQMAMA